MSRSVWFAAGAGAGVYAMVRARRLAEAATWDGLRDRAGAAVVGLRVFAEEVAQGSADKEAELRERLRLVPDAGLDSGLDTLASLAARPPGGDAVARPPGGAGARAPGGTGAGPPGDAVGSPKEES